MKAFLFALTFSAAVFSAAEKYYFAFPQSAGFEWGYGIPECKVHNDKVPKCKVNKALGVCRTEQQVELTDSETKKKNKFFIDHHFFNSKSECETAAGFIYGANED